jgi:uncharacterized damage-inducible protein DinB
MIGLPHRELLDYHYWARDRVLEAADRLPADALVRDLNGSFPSVRDTLVHILSAEFVWCARWHGESPTAHLAPAPFTTVAAIRSPWQEQEDVVRGFAGTVTDVDRLFEYRTFGGTATRSTFSQMLHHVVNHASYHRGQITLMLRQLQADPPQSQDLITFYRETR